MSPGRRVVITGIGVASPLGLSSADFWANLLAGEVAVRPTTRFDPGGFDSKVSGELPDYKITDHVPKPYRKATKVMARDIEIAVIAAKNAFDTAGLRSKADGDQPDFDPARFGCNIAAGLISADLDELGVAFDHARDEADSTRIDWKKYGREGIGQLTPLWLLKYLPNMLACHVTIVHGLTGPSNNLTCAEAGGHLSVGESTRAIRRGKCDLAIAGGAESLVNPMGVMRQQLLGRLTTSGGVRPFDRAADGTAAGEGGALLILEERGRAIGRGATIHAEIAGFAARQDTHDPVLPDPEGRAYAAACGAALDQAGITPADVGLIVPHGLGIPHHDQGELAGLRRVFGDGLRDVTVAPIKGQTGCPAAGCAVDLAAAALMLHNGRVPAAVHSIDAIGGGLDLPADPRETDAEYALCPVFGLGGQNAAVVLRRA